MDSPITTRITSPTDLSLEVSRFFLRIGAATTAMIGIWALACLAACLVDVGLMGLLAGYGEAITPW